METIPSINGSQVILYTLFLLLIIGIIVILVINYVHHINDQFRTRLEKQNKKSFDNFKSTIEEMNNKLLQEVIATIHTNSDADVSLSKEEQYQQHQKELLFTFSKLRQIIKDDLYKTMNDVEACRTALYLFHNGQQSTAGVSFIKVSCVGEKILIGSGVKERILNHANMPINIFDNMLENLINNGKYIVMNDDITMQTARAQFISSNKVKYSQMVAIYDSSNNILGFVLAEFDHNYNKNTADAEFGALKDLAYKIAPILSFSEYIKLTTKTSIDLPQRD